VVRPSDDAVQVAMVLVVGVVQLSALRELLVYDEFKPWRMPHGTEVALPSP
jgi:hypothetical protein